MALTRLLVLVPVVALSVGCIAERRPKSDAKTAAKATPQPTPPAAPADAPADAKAPHPDHPDHPGHVEPTAPPTPPPAGDPNHKAGEASRVPNYAVPAGDGPSKGPEDALVTIVEFNAFDCDECRKLPAILDRVLAKHAADVRLVFRHAPTAEDASKELSRAAVAAAAAGKFWEVHDELMTRGNLGPREVAKLVSDRGGDAAKYSAALADEASAAQVTNDLAVLDTFRGEAPAPIVFVNGRYLDGSITFEQIDALVTEEKAKAETFMKDNGVSRSAGLYEDMRKRGAPGGTPWRGYAQVGAKR
jgi:protein-disulfide isomerase